ncbi:MAG: AI-2E family transporter [archaeon]
MVDRQIVNKAVVLLLIIGIFIAAIYVLKPLIMAIFLGVFVAYIVHPLYNPVKKYVRGENFSTLVFCFLLVLLLAVPLFFLLPLFFKEIFNAYMYVQKIDLSTTIVSLLGTLFSPEITRAIAVQVNLFVATFFNFSITSFSNTFSDLPNLLLKFTVFLFTFYFATKDSEKIREYLSDLSPLSKSTEDKFSQEFRNITNAVIFGQILVGVIQGLCLGAGMWLLGVPKTGFLTLVAIITSIIPMVGAWLVWIPVSLYLFAAGNTLSGTILLLYGLLFVSTIDNILRPYFISKRSNVGTFVAILGIVGGLYSFGVIGLILGPLILSYVLIIVEFYRQGKLNELFRE